MHASKAIDFVGNIEEESVVFEPTFVNMYEKLEQLYNDSWVFPPWIKTILFEIKQLFNDALSKKISKDRLYISILNCTNTEDFYTYCKSNNIKWNNTIYVSLWRASRETFSHSKIIDLIQQIDLFKIDDLILALQLFQQKPGTTAKHLDDVLRILLHPENTLKSSLETQMEILLNLTDDDLSDNIKLAILKSPDALCLSNVVKELCTAITWDDKYLPYLHNNHQKVALSFGIIHLVNTHELELYPHLFDFYLETLSKANEKAQVMGEVINEISNLSWFDDGMAFIRSLPEYSHQQLQSLATVMKESVETNYELWTQHAINLFMENSTIPTTPPSHQLSEENEMIDYVSATQPAV